MDKKRLYLIDTTAFCYRAFYALGNLSTSFGQPTNAIFGFVNILNKILKEHKPGLIACCFDVSRDTFRSKKFTDYKIQRAPMPDDLKSQIPLIKEIIAAYGIKILEKEGFEADDIIATVSVQAKKKNIPVTVVSSDKDMLQVVDKDVVVFSPYKDEGTTYDINKVKERFGIGPEHIPDIIALMGDSVDNIPGVKGIGEKTAVNLLKEFTSVEKLITNIAKIKPDRIKQLIENNLDIIRMSKELAVLEDNVDIDLDLEDLKLAKPDEKELFRIFKYLEFKKMLKDFSQDDEVEAVSLERFSDADLEKKIGKIHELYLAGNSSEELVFFAKDRFFCLNNFGSNIKAILADPEVNKVGHDLKKIKVALAKESIGLSGLNFDLMIAAHLLNPSKTGDSLVELALEYLGLALNEDNLDNLKSLQLIRKLKVELEKQLSEKKLDKLFYQTEMPLVSVLAGMEINGIKIDVKFLKEVSQELEKKLKKIIEIIYKQSGEEFNINSPKQLRQILFEKLKLPVGRKSKTGPSTDEEVLNKLAKIHPLPEKLLEYRQLTKLKNTYVDALPELVDKRTGRIHATFNQTATETGRLSSSNPNLQNLPIKTEVGSQIRKAVISEKGFLLLACDYSQVELRILAHISGDEELIKEFRKDKDIHRATASLIYSVKEDEVTDQMRETAKRVNFGIVYGQTAFGLAKDLGISFTEAQNFIDAYFSRYPKVKEYIDGIVKHAQNEGFVTTILGRRRYLPEINSKNMGIRQFAERQAVNTPIQGSSSDFIKLAMIEIDKIIKERAFKSRMLIQVHDELVFDVDESERKVFVEIAREKMENVLKLSVPVKVSVKIGKNWLETEDVK